MTDPIAVSGRSAQSPWRRPLIAGLAIVLVAISWIDVVDVRAKSYVDGTITQAVAAFATARALNGFLTTAKSTQVSSGVVSVQPLEVLDPVHDLIEQYSSLMKISIASLLIQKFLIEVISAPIFKVALTVFAGLFLLFLYLGNPAYTNWAAKLFLIAAAVRFLFVAMVILNGMVDQAFAMPATSDQTEKVESLANQLEHSGQTNRPSVDEKAQLLEETEARKERLTELPALLSTIAMQEANGESELATIKKEIEVLRSTSGRSIWNPWSTTPELADARQARDELERTLSSLADEKKLLMAEKDNIEARLEEIDDRLEGRTQQGRWTVLMSRVRSAGDLARFDTLKQRADNLIMGILNLMALFFFRTLIMPVIFLYLLVKAFKALWGIDPMSALRNATQHVRQEISGKA